MAEVDATALARAQSKKHADHRAHELVGPVKDGVATIRCSCNVILVLPVSAAPVVVVNALPGGEESVGRTLHAGKGKVRDGSQ